ncbi:hypothetical protein AAFL31_07630 [Klebsiella huaxiensis]|uniref:hypothetical protein n=1 Tax=Klebsiella huaxiensis TaxID=2153354 RepID=UPI0031643371
MTSKLTITRERLSGIARGESCYTHDDVIELALAQLAAMDSEPVAGEARFKEERPRWTPCTAEHVSMVLANPEDWPNYEVRYLYAAPQPAPVVLEECPAEIRDLMASHSDALFNDDDAQEIWNACRAAMLQAGNSPVIPDGSASMLRRWLAFGRGMQNAGSQLPHNLIAETESMLAAAKAPLKMDIDLD